MDFALTTQSMVYDPRWNLMYLPYVADDVDQAKELLGPGGLVNNLFKEWSPDKNQYYLGTWVQGLTGVTLNEPATTPEEAKGIKIRVPNVAVWKCTWVTLGFTVTTMDYSEVPSALATGVVTGQAGGDLYQAYDCARDFNEYYVWYGDTFDPWGCVANLDAWNSINAADQKIIEDAAHEALLERFDTMMDEELKMAKILEDEYGWTIIDLSDYPEKMKAARDSVREHCWPIMDDIVGKVYMDKLREYHGMKVE